MKICKKSIEELIRLKISESNKFQELLLLQKLINKKNINLNML